MVALVLTLAIFGGAYLLWRNNEKRSSRLAAQRMRAETWAQRPLQAAFRGLYSYTRKDELPGKARRQLAKRIATQVAHPSFRYGVVSGEVGAGKSSLLDSGIARDLESGGFSVVLIRGLEEYVGTRTLDAVLRHLRRRLEECAAEPVLIFDQFEEALIEWSSFEARRELAKFLRQPLPDRPIRVLCGVRSDYIIALHDMSSELLDPTSSKTLFPVKNFEKQEASEVILECAQRDGFEFDETFAQALATDLARNGKVRPPELQLVCVALETSAPEQSYRLKGGAEGILSAYVRDAVAGAAAPDVARRVLRALCNFDALPPAKTKAKTVHDLTGLIGASASANAPRLTAVLLQLVAAGLVVMILAEDEKGYALVHDYLVQPIAIATSDATTEIERTTQLLRFHLAEYSADPRSRIPRRRLGAIRRYADRELLNSPAAQRLVRLSRLTARLRTAAAAAAAAIFITGLGYSLTMLEFNRRERELAEVRTLERQVVARQWELALRHERYVQRENMEGVIQFIEDNPQIEATTRGHLVALLRQRESTAEELVEEIENMTEQR